MGHTGHMPLMNQIRWAYDLPRHAPDEIRISMLSTPDEKSSHREHRWQKPKLVMPLIKKMSGHASVWRFLSLVSSPGKIKQSL